MPKEGSEPCSGLPHGLPASDRPLWETMTELQHSKASSRLRAITEWQAGLMPLAEALRISGLSRTRFYTVGNPSQPITRGLPCLG